MGRFSQEDQYRGDGLNLYTYVSNNPVKYIDLTGLAKCAAAKNFDKALDGLQMILDIVGFIPGAGDIADAVNLGISIFRGNVLDAVFSVIDIIPALGSAIATPLKTIFNAVGNASEITKAVSNLGSFFGGANKIVSKLDGVSKSLKTFANKIPSAIASLKNNYFVKTLIGSKKLNQIVSGVRNGINSLMSKTNQVISTVKKAVKKNIKEEAAKTTTKMKMNLQFFAEKSEDAWNAMGTWGTQSLQKHFEKHGKEVGAETAEQYLRKAEGFKQNLKGAKTSKVYGAVEGVIRYKKSGKYIDLAPDGDGTIVSFGKQ